MKYLLLSFIIGIGILSACKKHKVYTGVNEEPMYKQDRRVEEFRENSGISTTNSQALGAGSGGSYAASGSRQEILNAMAAKNKAHKIDSLNQIANMNTIIIQDSSTTNTVK